MRIQKHLWKHTRRVWLLQGQKDLMERLGGAAWVEQPAAAGAARGAQVHYTAGERSSAKRLRFRPSSSSRSPPPQCPGSTPAQIQTCSSLQFISFCPLQRCSFSSRRPGRRGPRSLHTRRLAALQSVCSNTQRSRFAWILKFPNCKRGDTCTTKKRSLDTWILDYCMYNGI